ncbi:MAG: hypothetical protein M1825_003690 [Sarcosagium campestre]|nr:MAG: hypothetical protein M1825_003690 [Sarcosagium campestre]
MRLQTFLMLASTLGSTQARQPFVDLEERSVPNLGGRSLLRHEERSLLGPGFACLGWGLISPVVGLFCYFSTGSDEEKAVEQKVLDAAENIAVKAATDIKDVVKFDLTHNPGFVAYNYVRTLDQDGITAANAGLRKTGKDFIDVTIGFTKESVNQGVQLYDLAEWSDVSLCLIGGVAELAANVTNPLPQTSRRTRRAVHGIDEKAGYDLAAKCIKEKFKKISDPNQKVGATISDIATLLIPVGEEEASVHAVEGAAADLAFPGEDSSRIYKWADDAVTAKAEHFSSPQEAQALADKLAEDSTWQEENCGACDPIITTAGKMRLRRSGDGGRDADRLGRIQRRAGFLSICCKVACCGKTPVQEGAAGGDDSILPESTDEAETAMSDLTDATKEQLEAAENSLGPSRELDAHDLDGPDSATAAAQLRAIMTETGTSALKWPKSLTDIRSSKDVFQDLRNIFENPNSDAFKALNVKPAKPGSSRLFFSTNEVRKASSDLLPKGFADFDRTARVACGDATLKVLEQRASSINIPGASIDYYYIPPGTEDPFSLAFHTDKNIMHFGAQDVDGIVFRDQTPGIVFPGQATGQKLSYRLQPQDDVFSAFKGVRFAREARKISSLVGSGFDATEHAVFGPEIVKNGRVSMVVSVGIVRLG